ncbi:MAG TPA: adenosylcobinamide-GDP ribazoletransferase [Candidatus Limnocylindrales bacterium]|jgi:adenosylcobinamide-GDP ribazoletransferase
MRAALATLTRFPVGGTIGTEPGAAWFAVVGALVGVTGLVGLEVARPLPLLGALLAVGAMAIVTGGLHLDGLADTADALVAPDPATADRARKDPALGVAGGAALWMVLALEVVGLWSVSLGAGAFAAGIVCVTAGACSRAVAVAVARSARNRASDGWGGRFAREVTGRAAGVAAIAALGIVALATLATTPSIAAGALIGTAVGVTLGLWLVRARRQLDGDGLGAIVELTFCAIVVATALAAAWVA